MFDVTKYKDACRDARDDAIRKYPYESCGAILSDGTYLSFQNVSNTPESSFDCGDERNPFFISGMIVAMVHSHPYEQDSVILSSQYPADFGPSKHDMIQQLADNVPWGIIATNGKAASDVVFWGNGIPDVPLLGRLFRHGPSGTDGRGDCYALIKDYYHQELCIDLPEGPRDYNWWHTDEDLYHDNLKRAGFYVIPKDQAKPGDVFFAQVNSKVANHGGILLEGGLILHHLSNRVSAKEPLLRWRNSIVTWIRHKERD